MKVSLIYLIFIFIKNAGSECTGKTEASAEKRLRDKLFCNYDKKVRPVKHYDNQTLIQFEIYPRKINLDEHKENMEFQGHLLYVWRDIFLEWDPREYEEIDFLIVSSNEIWVPDISLYRWSTTPSITSGATCHLENEGFVLCFTPTLIEVPCTPDITTYPFDTLNCTISFGSPGFYGKYINFTLLYGSGGIDFGLYKPNKVWELIKATTTRHVRDITVGNESTTYPFITSSFILKRHAAGHSAILIIPAAVLAGLTLLTFWMGTMYETRMTIGTAVILSDVLYFIYLGVKLPSNGNRVPIIVTFLRDSFLIASFSVVTSVVLRSIRTNSEAPSHWVSELLAKMESIWLVRMIFLGEGAHKGEDAVEMIEDPSKKITAWDRVATLIDRTAFVLCCMTYAILLMFYLP